MCIHIHVYMYIYIYTIVDLLIQKWKSIGSTIELSEIYLFYPSFGKYDHQVASTKLQYFPSIHAGVKRSIQICSGTGADVAKSSICGLAGWFT